MLKSNSRRYLSLFLSTSHLVLLLLLLVLLVDVVVVSPNFNILERRGRGDGGLVVSAVVVVSSTRSLGFEPRSFLYKNEPKGLGQIV